MSAGEEAGSFCCRKYFPLLGWSLQNIYPKTRKSYTIQLYPNLHQSHEVPKKLPPYFVKITSVAVSNWDFLFRLPSSRKKKKNAPPLVAASSLLPPLHRPTPVVKPPSAWAEESKKTNGKRGRQKDGCVFLPPAVVWMKKFWMYLKKYFKNHPE